MPQIGALPVDFCNGDAIGIGKDEVMKLEKFLMSPTGQGVRMLAQAYVGRGLDIGIGLDVFVKDTPDSAWRLCRNSPHPDWRSMSVDDYITRGRPEWLKYVSHGQAIQIKQELEALVDAHGCWTVG